MDEERKVEEHPSLRAQRLVGSRYAQPASQDPSALFDAAAPVRQSTTRELPAAASIYDPIKKTSRRVYVDDDVPGLPGYAVSEIDPVRGVRVIGPADSNQPDYWIPPQARTGGTTPETTKHRRDQDAMTDYYGRIKRLIKGGPARSTPVPGFVDRPDQTPAETAAKLKEMFGDVQEGQDIGDSTTQPTTGEGSPEWRLTLARIHERENIPYGAANEAWLADAVEADFVSMDEVGYSENYENTGYTLYTMENSDGELRTFLVSPKGEEIINVTGLVQ